MKVNDRVSVKTDGGPRRIGRVLEVEVFSEGVMYLVALDDYPNGVWFFNEADSKDGTFIEPLDSGADAG
ncbi:protein DsrB [Enterobacillus tribolii]|uniref:Dextransucrase DSRB n=1 Tax=Enterobacillus tribolii TaxID=1487935 RepID=A0A370R3L1_9GAMM|nr:protein DsrB [Enterobacillus tribolii]MBW7984084.1 protein DsrB [Enterobacillus tribolii]RDK97024.1 dextransucrase DSRB [Enterobacillus tribolii]